MSRNCLPIFPCRINTYFFRAAREAIGNNAIINRFNLKNSKLPILIQPARPFGTPSSRHPLGREGTVMPKLKRLPKKKMVNPPDPRCKPKKKDRCKRADDGLKVKPKELPVLVPIDCPCLDTPPLKEGEPLRPPKKTHEPKAPPCRPRKKDDFCAPRADKIACLKVVPKKLPKIVPGECPCITKEMKDCEPLKRLPPVEVQRPKKQPCPVAVSICAPRADAKLKIKPKRLPVLKPPPCPCVEGRKWIDVKLPRLKKVKVVQKRVCKPIVKDECPPRLDKVKKYRIKKKELMTMIMSSKYNNMGIREFNKKVKSKKKKTKKSKGRRSRRSKGKKSKKGRKGKKSGGSGKRRYHTDCNGGIDNRITDSYQPDAKANLLHRNYRQFSYAFDDAFAFDSKARSMMELDKEDLSNWLTTNIFRNPAVNQNLFCVKLKRLMSSQDLQRTKSCAFYTSSEKRLIERQHSRSMSTGGDDSQSFWSFFNIFGSSKKDEVEPHQGKVFFNESIIQKPQLSGMPMSRRDTEKRDGTRNFSTESKVSNDCCSDPCPQPEPKSLWQKIVDYFKARPNCPAPDEWKKKALREKAEKAAAKAGLYICDKPPKKKKLPCVITDNDVDLSPPKKLFGCQMFKLKNCPPLARKVCEPELKRKSCKPQEAPYPSFSQCRPPFPSIRDAECEIAVKKWNEIKDEYKRNLTRGYHARMEADAIKAARKRNSKRKCQRNYSTSIRKRGSSLYQKRYYSNNRNKRDSDDPFAFFENATKEKLRKLDQKELAQRILDAVRKGMEVLEKNNGKNVEDPYYRIYKELEQLCQPEAEKQLKHSVISKGQSLCGSFSDLGSFGVLEKKVSRTVPLVEQPHTSDVQGYEESGK